MKLTALRTLAAALAVTVGISGALVACGGDDQFVQPGGPGSDGGKTDGSIGDGGKTDGGDGGNGDGGLTDGGDGGPSNCGFTNFVISTISTGTNEISTPVPNAMIPDPSCSLDGSLQDYSSLPNFH